LRFKKIFLQLPAGFRENRKHNVFELTLIVYLLKNRWYLA
jgi:hypothetical protein